MRIRGLGVIEDAVLPLGPGLTVVTGETGAGKTMVVQGLGLLFGGRADAGRVRPFDGETSLFITPGFRFRAAGALLTNFHLPRSTLFMLTCAFAGTERMRHAYAHAIAAGYRFYSYGDACLLERA